MKFEHRMIGERFFQLRQYFTMRLHAHHVGCRMQWCDCMPSFRVGNVQKYPVWTKGVSKSRLGRHGYRGRFS